MKAEYEYAKKLATYLWKTHYKENVPGWEPCEDLMGVLTQIDNMIVGLKKPWESDAWKWVRRWV